MLTRKSALLLPALLLCAGLVLGAAPTPAPAPPDAPAFVDQPEQRPAWQFAAALAAAVVPVGFGAYFLFSSKRPQGPVSLPPSPAPPRPEEKAPRKPRTPSGFAKEMRRLAAGSDPGKGKSVPKQSGALSTPAPVFRLMDYQSLLAASRDEDQCDRVARYYGDAGKGQDFVNQNRGRGAPSFYTAFARAFLKSGEYRTAMALLQMKDPAEPEDAEICAALRKHLARKAPFVEERPGLEKLTLAEEFSRRKLNREALALLTDEVILSAAEREDEARIAAGVLLAAKKAVEFVEWRSNARPPGFYRAYAAAFSALNDHESALALLKAKKLVEPEDYALRVFLEKAVGRRGLRREAVPDAHRASYAEAIMQVGEEKEALEAVLEDRKGALGKEDYALALRLCLRLDQFETAARLFEDLRKVLPLKDAPELYYYFAIFCEKRGELRRARDIYGKIEAAFKGYKDVERRLELLSSIPAEEEIRLTATLSPAAEGKAPEAAGEAGALIGGKYELQKPLGVGGMGVVYKGFDRALSREVAVKKLLAEISADKASRARFIEEARVVAALNHPYIVSIHDIVSAGREIYLVFEYVDGETLAEIAAGRGRISARDCAKILRFVCEALAYAHENGVIHRDLKPSNIMMNKRGYVKVMDFGLAGHATASSIGGAAGTPAYMAPEQHRGKASVASDIYALGATAYELLAGRLPFSGKDLAARKAAEDYQPLPEDVPAGLRELVVQCLRSDPASRPGGIGRVLEMLKSAV